jgi:trehalose synthase
MSPPSGGLLRAVRTSRRPVASLAGVIGAERYAGLLAAADDFRGRHAGRTVWNVNSTSAGGGVAEMLQTLVGYVGDLGIDMRWLVIGGDPVFFGITKNLHNALHGYGGDRPARAADRLLYEAVLAANAEELLGLVRPGDIVLLHDPQTAGLAPWLVRAGVVVIWRCHIGSDRQTGVTRAGWDFLRPYLEGCHAFVFSRGQYVPPWMPAERAWIIPPSIDPFAPKNQDMDPATVRAVLGVAGLLAGSSAGPAAFVRRDGTRGVVTRRATVIAEGLPGPDEPTIVQVSRWDRLKDMAGVLTGFARYVAPHTGGRLALVGPSTAGVADDPEGAAVYAECLRLWQGLSSAARARVMLVSLPLDDVDENAAMVNALQRHATVVTQKSLAEGFGLTVAEAMWKGRPVIGSAVGGIPDQITTGTGVLLPDPTDLEGFGGTVRHLLADREQRELLGLAAHEHVRCAFVGDLHLRRYGQLFARVAP